MRRGLVLTAAVAAVACGLSSDLVDAAAQSQPQSPDSGACAVVVADLRGQIEAIKELKADSAGKLQGFPGKRRLPEAPDHIAAREREQANALNAMLPGMGCPRVDIDAELAQPLDRALHDPAPKASKKHRKHH